MNSVKTTDDLAKRKRFVTSALSAGEHILAMIKNNPKGWEAYKLLIQEKISECDFKLDWHRGMTDMDRALELERKATLRSVLRTVEDTESGMEEARTKLSKINSEIAKRKTLG